MTASQTLPPGGDWADRMEQAVLDAAVRLAPTQGWNAAMVRAACADNDLSRGDEELLLPNGARDLAALLSRRHDARALSARMEVGAADLEATRRCAAFLALPLNADLGLKLAWESADHLWHWAGDTATDWNHYSKRTILSGILIPALTMRWFDGRAPAEAFVARRIENVMAFEKWKAGKDFEAPFRRVSDALSRMRYGAKDQPAS